MKKLRELEECEVEVEEKRTAHNEPCHNSQKLQQWVEGLEEIIRHESEEHEYSREEYVNELGEMKQEISELNGKLRIEKRTNNICEDRTKTIGGAT